jgi:hypothetical protein
VQGFEIDIFLITGLQLQCPGAMLGMPPMPNLMLNNLVDSTSAFNVRLYRLCPPLPSNHVYSPTAHPRDCKCSVSLLAVEVCLKSLCSRVGMIELSDVELSIMGYSGSPQVIFLLEAFESMNITATLPGLNSSLLSTGALESKSHYVLFSGQPVKRERSFLPHSSQTTSVR